MTNRLSEEVLIATWDAGRQLPTLGQRNEYLIGSSTAIKISDLLRAKDPRAAVQAVDRREIYSALVAADPEDALEAMPLLSQEQFVAIIDYEGWNDQELSIHKVIRWLELYKQHGLDQMFDRFRQLDEEYQTGLLSPYVDVVDEEAYEKLSHDLQDQYRELPCHTLWYRVRGSDESVEEFVDSLVEGGLAQDVAFTYSLLSMATYLPPNEQEELLRQFRTARIEEDGFASPAESREMFMPFDGQSLFDRWNHKNHDHVPSKELVSGWHGAESYLEAVFLHILASGQYDSSAIDGLKRSFAVLANNLASACHVPVDDVRSLSSLMGQSHGIVSLGLEILANGRVDLGAEILFTESPKVIFQFALSTVDTIRDRALEVISENDWPGLDSITTNYKARKFGATLWHIDRELIDQAGLENVEVLKGLFNRIPMVVQDETSRDASIRYQFKSISRVSELRDLQSKIENMRPFGRSALEPVTESADIVSH